MTTSNFDEWLTDNRNAIERRLPTYLPSTPDNPEGLTEAINYAVLGGGKRLRALLCVASAELCHHSRENAQIIGCAIEMIHAYSLVHDDLPCMDNDTLRRGKPTCHVQYGEAIALLVGDALLTQAFFVINEYLGGLTSTQISQLNVLMASSAGAAGMVGGQYLDILSTGKTLTEDALQTLHQKKTGCLIRASIMSGTFLGATPEMLSQDLNEISSIMGLLYQIVDDILDVESDTALLGKTAGKDAHQEKSTYVKLLGLEGAKAERDRLFKRAQTLLNSYGPDAHALMGLLERISYRNA